MADGIEDRMRARVEEAKQAAAAHAAAELAQRKEEETKRSEAVSRFGSAFSQVCNSDVAAVHRAIADIPATVRCEHSNLASIGQASVILKYQNTSMTLSFTLMKDNKTISIEKNRSGVVTSATTDSFHLRPTLNLNLQNLAQIISETIELFVTYSLKLKAQNDRER